MHAKMLPHCQILKIICYDFGSLSFFVFETLQSEVSKQDSIGTLFGNKKTTTATLS